MSFRELIHFVSSVAMMCRCILSEKKVEVSSISTMKLQDRHIMRGFVTTANLFSRMLKLVSCSLSVVSGLLKEQQYNG